jgi:dTDP-4-dehydrorhamnose 3,5-epimerase
MVVQGAAVVGAVEIDNWEAPSRDCKVWRYVLTAKKPSILLIPAGFANGFMSLTNDTKLLVFSDKTLEETQGDDIRYPARYWDIWTVAER